MERLVEYIEELHHKEEEAYITGNQEALQLVGSELDQIVTDEAVEAMKGEA